MNDLRSPVKPRPFRKLYKVDYAVIDIHFHHAEHFTQGLAWDNYALYEGTGIVGLSQIVKTNFPSTLSLSFDQNVNNINITNNNDDIVSSIETPQQQFGEGITILNGRLYQLTWQDHLINVYDLDLHRLIQAYHWSKEGWGLTNDGTHLIISDGTSTLYFVDPIRLKVVRSVEVDMLTHINDLQYIDGIIFANVYGSDYLYLIDSLTGIVKGYVDLTVIAKYHKAEGILNGITYYPPNHSLLVTGKNWSKMYEIALFS